jgi:hypothetical protein
VSPPKAGEATSKKRKKQKAVSNRDKNLKSWHKEVKQD